MRWRGRRQSSNIEDRRGTSGFGRGASRMRLPIGLPTGGGGLGRIGGGGLGLIAIVVIAFLIFGGDLGSLIGGGGSTVTSQNQTAPPGAQMGAPADDPAQFVATILADTEDIWTAIFQEQGARYELPTLVLFSQAVDSACGFASAASGPFYCPADRKIYIDLAFYDELRREFQAPGDVAQAYVLAHEVGHHVQNLLGTLGQVNARRGQMSEGESNRLSVRTELQADCYAGIWGNHTNRLGLLEPNEIEEALNAAAQIGDDAIQRRTRGTVVPESFNHGSSAQRVEWFRRGYDTGQVDACDTFAAGAI